MEGLSLRSPHDRSGLPATEENGLFYGGLNIFVAVSFGKEPVKASLLFCSVSISGYHLGKVEVE